MHKRCLSLELLSLLWGRSFALDGPVPRGLLKVSNIAKDKVEVLTGLGKGHAR